MCTILYREHDACTQHNMSIMLHIWLRSTNCVSCFICLVLSTLTHTFLLISEGAIPASTYKSSTFVGFRHPMIQRHAWFSSGSNYAYVVDLAQTGTAYSPVE